MRRRSVLLLLAVFAGGYAWLLPARPIAVAAAGVHVRGAVHVHTSRSDGTGTAGDVAAAAARAGLNFVILTDHGDATRQPDPPVYIDGVLVIDAVEVSTTTGHVVALGLREAAPYPLAGEGRDAVEDIQRLGGIAIAAHLGSPKPELQWTDPAARLDGLEWINGDSEWRDEGAWSLLRALATYPAGRAAAIGTLLDRPELVIAHWDRLLQARPVVGLAAVDAHARIGVDEPYDSRLALRIPSYEATFETMSIALESATLSGDAAADAGAVFEAIRRGAVFSAIDAVATGGSLRVSGSSGVHRAASGGALPLDGPVALRVESNAPPGAAVVIVKDGQVFQQGSGSLVEIPLPNEPAVYRVEVLLPRAPGTPPVPWLMSNPIYVGRADAAAFPPAHTAASKTTALFEDGATTSAVVEQGGQSQAAIGVVPSAPAGRQLLFRYAISGRASDSPYAAAAFPVTGVADFARLSFTARADRPMRLAVQLRVPGGTAGQRWRRSVYVGETPRPVEVAFDDLRPAGGSRSGTVPLADVDSLLFVVDSTHTPLGTSGRIWLDDVRLER